MEGAPTAFLGHVLADSLDFVTRLATRPAPVTGPKIVLSQHYPVYVPEHRGVKTLAGHAIADIALRLHGLQTGLAAQRRLGVPRSGAVWTHGFS